MSYKFQGVKATGRMIRDYLPRWDEDQEDKGRSIITDETTEDVDAIADMVKKAVDVFFPPEAQNDFPVAMQVGSKF